MKHSRWRQVGSSWIERALLAHFRRCDVGAGWSGETDSDIVTLESGVLQSGGTVSGDNVGLNMKGLDKNHSI